METQQPPGTITAEFVVEGQAFDPVAFSQAAGREPGKIWHQKVPALQGNPAFAQIGWYFTLEKHPHWSVDDAIRELLGNFAGRRDEIVAFARQHNCFLHVWLRLYGDSTQIEYLIERETIERLCGFRCSLSFSIETDAA